MKRIISLVLAAAFVLGSIAGASAATEVKMTGDARIHANWFSQYNWTGMNDATTRTADQLVIWERFRLRTDFVANEALKFRLGIRVNNKAWGNDTFTYDNPNTSIDVYQAYLQFMIPQTEIEISAGLQDVSLPQASFFNDSVIAATRMASAIVKAPLMGKTLGVVAGYVRPVDSNVDFDVSTVQKPDTVDMFFLALPVTLDGFKITPWGALAIVPRDNTLNNIYTNEFAAHKSTLWANMASGGSGYAGVGSIGMNNQAAAAGTIANVYNALAVPVYMSGASTAAPVLGQSAVALAAMMPMATTGVYPPSTMAAAYGFFAPQAALATSYTFSATTTGAIYSGAIPLVGINPSVTPYGTALAVLGHVEPVTVLGAGIVYPANALYPGSPATTMRSPIARTGWRNSTNNYWWVGAPIEITVLDPFKAYFDVIYGSGAASDRATNHRSGWFLDGAIEYTGLSMLTPQIAGWWSSGEDGSIRNGSERIAFMNTNWNVNSTSQLFDAGQSFYRSGLGLNPIGSWGVSFALKKISFIQDLTHNLVFTYAQGTNSNKALQTLNYYYGNGQYVAMGKDLGLGENMYSINLDHKYMIYENLAAIVESGWAHGNFSQRIWGRRLVHEAQQGDVWKVAFGVEYKF